MKVNQMQDVMKGSLSVEILDFYTGNVVRTLTTVTEGQRPFNTTIHMACPNGDSVDVEPETPLAYESWGLERGSILFNKNMKRCTELDAARYPDGTVESIEPGESLGSKLNGAEIGWITPSASM